MTLDDVMAELKAIRALLERRPAASAAPMTADIDGKYGNPTVRRDPPRWSGESYKDRQFSDCPPAYLRELAGFLDWQAGKDEQKSDDEQAQKYARFKRIDAGRARAWADRIEAGGAPPPKQTAKDESESFNGDDSDVPF